ncbi:PREDICTED: uncharacterized protein LOC109114649 [Nelumbo nucifera]|uniref:Uncharacterized protein LOC109114649 n=1 Tax=Nelumbo nucifera TaxID=4432 RepID=A0A1U8Q2Z3_NELNU|nr:PREDICTED: uncharacterized protein LOC109114649 [Nelumbo nucifera]
MKRRKRVTKQVRVESPRAVEPEVPSHPPVINLESPREPEVAGPDPEVAAEPEVAEARNVDTTEASHTQTVFSNSGSQEGVGSVLTSSCALRKCKKVVYPAEVSEWADLPPGHISTRTASHAMVVNTSIHALTIQSERNLKRTQAAKEASRAAQTELRIAWERIYRLEGDTSAQKNAIETLTSEKVAMDRELERLRRENGALRIVVKHLANSKGVLEHEVEYLKADIKEKSEIFFQAIEDNEVKAVEDYIASERFDDLMVGSYRRGFKLSRWMIRHTYPGLDTRAITTSRITLEMALAADDDPDSEDEVDASSAAEVSFDDLGEGGVPPK